MFVSKSGEELLLHHVISILVPKRSPGGEEGIFEWVDVTHSCVGVNYADEDG